MKYKIFQCFFVSFLIALTCISCKKDRAVDPAADGRSADERLKDSVYFYYQRYSLWGDASVPDVQTIHSFSDAYDSPVAVLTALKNRTPFVAAYGGGVDRFSYLEDLNTGIADEMNEGFGMFMSIGAVANDRAYPVVYLAEGGSPAALAGIKRSDVILGIDEFTDLSIPVSCTGGRCTALSQTTFQNVVNTLLLLNERKTMKVRLRRSDMTEVVISLSAAQYAVNPIAKSGVLNALQRSVGYLAFSSFEDLSEGKPNRNAINAVFESFEQEGISDLVVDLRYNSGGYVSAAAFMANKIVPASGDGKLMYSYGLNTYLAAHPDVRKESFDAVYFKRNNNLSLHTVYFLVNNATASAAELLINVLKPYMNVKLIAENKATFGKPVGFFKQELMAKQALWVASFKLINARGETDYYNGLIADQQDVPDDIFHDFGDPEESMLAAALNLGAAGARVSSSKGGRLLQVPMRSNIVNAKPIKNMLYQ